MSPIRRAAAVAAATSLVVVAACGTEDSDDGGSGQDAAQDGGPVVIEHVFGETAIPEGVDDVVTLGWGSTDAALALGVVPVGIEAQTYAADDAGRVPWIAEALDEAGADPVMIPPTVEDPAYEDIDALSPDLILAPYSGITEEQYGILSDIAPTVVYPDEPWATPWREVIEITGEALGLAEEAEQLVADIDAEVAEAAGAHPELEGKTVAAVWDDAGTFFVYRAADPRVEFLFDLGFEHAPAVDELGSGGESFYYELSYEETSRLESDILVNYASDEEHVETFLDQSYAQAIPAVRAGAVAHIVGEEYVSAVSPPTALSVSWGLDEYVGQLAEAARAAE